MSDEKKQLLDQINSLKAKVEALSETPCHHPSRYILLDAGEGYRWLMPGEIITSEDEYTKDISCLEWHKCSGGDSKYSLRYHYPTRRKCRTQLRDVDNPKYFGTLSLHQ